MANSFLHAVNQVNFGTYKPEDVEPALTQAEQLARKREATIVAIKDDEHTYQNTVQALLDAADEFDHICHIVGHFGSVLGKDWEQYETLANERATKYYADRGLDESIYKAIKAVQNRQDKLGLSRHKKRLLDDIVVGFERSGINLPPKQREHIKAIKAELSTLSTQFAQNTVQASDAAHLIVKDESELAGIDEEQLAEWRKAAKEKSVEGYYIQYSPPNYDQIMTLCDIQATRQRMHRLNRSRAPQNEPLARRMLELRREYATLVGYKDYADYVTERRMAKSGTRARDFIKSLTDSYAPYMRKEAEALKTYIRQKTGHKAYELDITDVDGGVSMYWASKMRAEQINLNESTLREYFPLDTVLSGMFDVLQTLYGITIKKADEPTYHEDVQVYHIYDEQNRHLSTVWCDWFARNGKRAGAWAHVVHIADRAANKVDEPLFGFVCANVAPPTKTKPSLLDMRDVETLWHEFGHFIHATFGKTELREQNGYECAWDFIEAPSQIMENWVWQDEVLAKITSHYKTGEPMPTDVIQKLRASRSFRAASTAMWTLFWSTADLALHVDYNPLTDKPVATYTRNIKNDFFAVKIPDYDVSICTFTHIFAGGYAAGYYGYKWAESIEADLFSRFKKEGVLNAQTGRAYRDNILAHGDEADPEELIQSFLGRQATTAAMLERDELK